MLLCAARSPAARGRGLKQIPALIDDKYVVARRARAWIETVAVPGELLGSVARRARAWIETPDASDRSAGRRVARRARAWIETVFAAAAPASFGSPAARGRGLKLRTSGD